MFILKQKYILILVFLLFPSSVVYSAWSEPTQAPTGGNASVPIYSEGSGQTLVGTLHVDPTATNPTSLQGSGSTNGVQGNSVGNALFGNLTNNAAGGGRAVYGLAVDAADYGLYTSGGLGLGVASGDIWFMQQDQGIAWPRESDGASLYGVYVTNTGELQVRGHGAGINFMDQNAASRLTVSEAGVVNVAAGGSLRVNNVLVCLQDGTNCPASATPTLQQVTTSGNTSSNQILLTPAANVEALRVVTSNWSPLVIRNAADNADIFRVDQNGNAAATGNITAAGQNVCRQDGTNCPAGAPPPAGADLWLPNGNDIYPNFTGDVKVNHGLFFNGDTAAQAIIDFDPYEGNLSNYLLIRSGVNATFGEKNHFRINRDGNTYLAWDTYFGSENSSGVQSMSPASYKWAIRYNPPKIEARAGGDIDLKNGTLTAGSANLSSDIFLQNDKSVRIDANNATNLIFGNYNGNGGVFTYGGTYDLNLAVEGDVKANRLCFGNADCKANWDEIVQGGGGAYWTLNGSSLYPDDNNYNIGIGNSAPGAYKLNVSGSAALGTGGTLDSLDASNFYINGNGDVQIRVDTNNNGSNQFKINNGTGAGGATVFSVNESGNANIAGNLVVSGIDNRIGGAASAIPLAVKTDTSGNGIAVECGVVGCNSSIEFLATNSAYTTIKVNGSGAFGVGNLALLPSPGANVDGGKVGIGTTAPNAQLHIKTNKASSNAELDIQSNASPYWAIYQDDGTDELRFWNNNVVNNKNALTFNATSGDVVVNNALGVGTVPSWRFHVSDTVNQYAAQIDGNMIITGNKSLCLDGDCKNDWGPNTGNTFIRTLQPVDGLDYDCTRNDAGVAQVGYIMIGIRNTNPAKLICARMW